MATRPEIEIGKKYVVQVKSYNTIDLLREHTVRERFMFNFLNHVKTGLKILLILASVLFPPLLLMTIPLLKQRKSDEIIR